MSLVALPTDVTQGGRVILMDADYADDAARIARAFGVKVSSGYRSAAANAEAGGATNSDHLRGDADDFVGTKAQLSALYTWAVKQGFPYVEPMGQSGDHVHISFKRAGQAAGHVAADVAAGSDVVASSVGCGTTLLLLAAGIGGLVTALVR